MAITTIRHFGIVPDDDNNSSVRKAAALLVADLKANGFTEAASSDTTVILNVPDSIDPLVAGNDEAGIEPQKWRIAIDTSYPDPSNPNDLTTVAQMRIFMGTSNQLTDDVTFAVDYFADADAATTWPPDNGYIDNSLGYRLSGELSGGAKYSHSAFGGYQTTIPFFCYDGADTTKKYSNTFTDMKAHPLATQLCLSDHGFSFVIWVEGQDNMGNKFSWFTVQRLVDVASGLPRLTGKCPVFCLFSIGGGNPENVTVDVKEEFYKTGLPTRMPAIYKMVVREVDVTRPSAPVNACISTTDHNAVINPYQQISIYENMTYALTMPNGFNSLSYRYKEEMDLMMYTSADVISAHNKVTLTMFGRQRTYTASLANLPDNAGMRVLFLTDEVDVTVTPP